MNKIVGRRAAALAALSVALLSSCVTVNGKPTSASPTITVPPVFPVSLGCGDQCDGKEPDTTQQKCGGPDATNISPRLIEGIDVTGTVSLRKADPALCDRSFWVRVDPAGNTTPFTIRIYRNGKPYPAQLSQPGNPAMEAWTVMAQGEVGDVIRGCVENTETKESFCLPNEKVTG